MGQQPLSTILPHIENGSSRTRCDLDTYPARVMKTSLCMVDKNAPGASNITARWISGVSSGLWDFIWGIYTSILTEVSFLELIRDVDE